MSQQHRPDANAKVYKDDHGAWRWRLRAANGEIVAVGESYTRRADALRGMWDALKTFNAALAPEDHDPPEAA